MGVAQMDHVNAKIEIAGLGSNEEAAEVQQGQGKDVRKLDELELMLVGGGDCVVCW